MNLFSSFDPFCSILSFNLGLNWLSSLSGFLYLPMSFWVITNRFSYMIKSILYSMSKEFKLVMTGEKFGSYFLFLGLFLSLILNNFLGLFPYIFTSSSHLCFSLMFSFSFWFSFMIFGWLNNTNMMFSHLVPMGTPTILMPLLVCIETISNLIRSGTLAIRLTANMISGHLLLTLIGNQGSELNYFLLFILLFFQCMLMMLEISVSMIQSYVFSILASLYSGEVNMH